MNLNELLSLNEFKKQNEEIDKIEDFYKLKKDIIENIRIWKIYRIDMKMSECQLLMTMMLDTRLSYNIMCAEKYLNVYFDIINKIDSNCLENIWKNIHKYLVIKLNICGIYNIYNLLGIIYFDRLESYGIKEKKLKSKLLKTLKENGIYIDNDIIPLNYTELDMEDNNF